MQIDAQDIRDQLLPTAERVAAYLREVYARHLESGVSVRRKADSSLITEADTTAHNMLMYDLQKLYPEIPVISEEGDFGTAEARASWRYYWLVDPLDGTREFVEKTGEFSINIALMKQGKPWFGMVILPMLEKVYAGGDTLAACCYSEQQWRPCGEAKDDATLRILISLRALDSPMLQTMKLRLLAKGIRYETIVAGSAYKYCELLKYPYAVYPRFGSTSHWDTAAGHALVNAHGGNVFSFNGDELHYPNDTLLNKSFIGLSAACMLNPDRWINLFSR